MSPTGATARGCSRSCGVGPSIVVLDHGMARAMTTTTARSDIYAVFFDQKGLMAGIGIQGTKITPIHPK